MNLLDIINDKVILLNTGILTMTFMDIEAILKLVLLIISIVYTIIKIITRSKGDKDIEDHIKDYFNKNRK